MVTDEAMLATAQRWFGELWSEGALDVADAIVAQEYNPDWIHIDETGPEQVKHEIRYFRSVFPDLIYRILDNSIGNARVWTRYQGQGTYLGRAWGFDPTGKQATFEGVTILYFNENGKIRDQWGAFCFYEIFVELGLVPPYWELSPLVKHFGGTFSKSI